MRLSQAKLITELVLKHKYRHILELGFKHGVSTCYLAAAVAKLGGGLVTTIDRTSAASLSPNLDELLAELKLNNYVKAFYEPTSYNWRLMRFIEESPSPSFDFCYIDGAHDWFTDGLAFFLVDRLLAPGGMLVLDDMNWTFSTSPTLRLTERVIQMPDEERFCQQVRQIFQLLIRRHPNYCNFREIQGWGIAQKRAIHSGT